MRSVWVLTLVGTLLGLDPLWPLCVRAESPLVPGAESRPASAPTLRVSVASECLRKIDGFGTTAPAKLGAEPWLQELYFGDLGASMLRLDLTPRFRAPISDVAYNSPWFHGQPGLPGPEGNNVRTYRGLADYGRAWYGRSAPIAVLGDDIEQNLSWFDFASPEIAAVGELARQGFLRASGDARLRAGERSKAPAFKLIGSIWSPAPWLKQSSGGHFEGSGEVMPKPGTPWPFIWAGNFAGGELDTSGEPRAELADASGKTSALEQFTRITVAYLLGFQRAFGVRFSAISLQNELNFETFYNSCTYPRASGYIAVLKALRRAFDRVEELREVAIIGPEDLLDAEPYALWQYGSASSAVHKNLQYLAAIAGDREASAALSFFAVHAYARDGVRGSGDDDRMWRWWLDGWSRAPAAGLPARVLGTRAFRKKSWMTESSGEANVWLPAAGAPLSDSALGLALKVQRALTVGQQSAWLYWQLLDGKPVSKETLTDATLRERSPKYVAYKHFARFIRPDACVVTTITQSADKRKAEADYAREVYVSAYRQPTHETTIVLVNTSHTVQRVDLTGLASTAAATLIESYASSQSALWQKSTFTAKATPVRIELPARGVVTLHAQLLRK